MLSGLFFLGLSADWPSSPDGWQHHLPRIHALAEALRAGVLYPRWFPDLSSGFGEPVLNYYSPGFYYPPALLLLTGLDTVMCARFTLATGFALSALWMFRLSRLYVSLWPAVVSVVCFQFYPYRFIAFYKKAAFPEFMAFMWLPLIVFYTLRAVTELSRAHNGAETESKRGASYPSYLVKAGLAWVGLILTHNLTALMAALVLGAVLALTILLQYRFAHWRVSHFRHKRGRVGHRYARERMVLPACAFGTWLDLDRTWIAFTSLPGELLQMDGVV